MTSILKDSTSQNGPQSLETWPLSQRMADAVFGGAKEILLNKEDLVKLFDAVIVLSKYTTSPKNTYHSKVCEMGGYHKPCSKASNLNYVYCKKCEIPLPF